MDETEELRPYLEKLRRNYNALNSEEVKEQAIKKIGGAFDYY